MGSQGGVGSRSSRARGEIVRTAGTLMLEQGYAAVTYRGVATRAGVTAGLVQYYFPTPDELFVAVLTDWTDATVTHLTAVTDSDRPLRAIWHYANDRAGSAMLLEFMALANHRKAIGPVIGAGGERVRRALVEALEGVGRRYRLSGSDIPPAAIVFLMSATARMIHLENAYGTHTGHAEAVELVERYLDDLEPLPALTNQKAML